MIAYSLQIYCDFSGYSDMAIGISRIIGFDLPENFNMPYSVDVDHGVLAPLAHHVVAVAARLPLHSAGRKPQGQDSRTYVNLIAHDAARRTCGTARTGRSSSGARCTASRSRCTSCGWTARKAKTGRCPE